MIIPTFRQIHLRLYCTNEEINNLSNNCFICMFCRSLFFLFSFFFWPLRCLFFDIQIIIAPFVSIKLSLCCHCRNVFIYLYDWKLNPADFPVFMFALLLRRLEITPMIHTLQHQSLSLIPSTLGNSFTSAISRYSFNSRSATFSRQSGRVRFFIQTYVFKYVFLHQAIRYHNDEPSSPLHGFHIINIRLI